MICAEEVQEQCFNGSKPLTTVLPRWRPSELPRRHSLPNRVRSLHSIKILYTELPLRPHSTLLQPVYTTLYMLAEGSTNLERLLANAGVQKLLGTALLGRSIVEGSYPDVGEVPLSTWAADVVDGVLQDDMAEEEVAQMLEDLSMQESVQSKVVVNDSQVICQTTVLVTNAAGLIEKTGNKFKAFHRMVKNLDPKPDIIVVHELGGYSGAKIGLKRAKEQIRVKLVGALRRYDCVYTQKPLMDEGDHKAGAGAMILLNGSSLEVM